MYLNGGKGINGHNGANGINVENELNINNNSELHISGGIGSDGNQTVGAVGGHGILANTVELINSERMERHMGQKGNVRKHDKYILGVKDGCDFYIARKITTEMNELLSQLEINYEYSVPRPLVSYSLTVENVQGKKIH